MFNPCCCNCLLASDNFNRSDSSDINDGAPITYDVVSGTWEISGNTLVTTSVDAKLLFPELPPEPYIDRVYSVDITRVIGDYVRFFFGEYYFEYYFASSAADGYYAIKQVSDDALMEIVPVASTAGTSTWTLQFGVPTLSGTAYYAIGFSYGTYFPFAHINNRDFGIGTGATASGPIFDNLAISQNVITTTTTSGGCLQQSITPCRASGPNSQTASTAITPDFEALSGTWTRANLGLAGYAFKTEGNGTLACLSYRLPKAKYAQLTGIRNAANTGLYNWATGDSCAIWLEDGQTGIVTTYTSNCPAPAGSTKVRTVEIYLQGVLQDSVELEAGTTGSVNGLIYYVGGRVYFIVSGQICGAKNTTSYQWAYEAELDEPQVMTVEDNFSGSSARHYQGTFGDANGPGPQLYCNASTRSCSGTASNFNVTPDGIGGACGDTNYGVGINGTTFLVNGSTPINNQRSLITTATVCGHKRPILITVNFGGRTRDGSGATIDEVDVWAWIQVGPAWALFVKRYTTNKACNDIDEDLTTLHDYHNADGIDMSAVTCHIESV